MRPEASLLLQGLNESGTVEALLVQAFVIGNGGQELLYKLVSGLVVVLELLQQMPASLGQPSPKLACVPRPPQHSEQPVDLAQEARPTICCVYGFRCLPGDFVKQIGPEYNPYIATCQMQEGQEALPIK